MPNNENLPPIPPPSKKENQIEKKSALQTYKEKYIPIRRASKKSPDNNEERLKIKSDIANTTTQGDPTLKEHVQKIYERISQRKSGSKSITHVSDGMWNSTRREPSLVEAIVATKESDKTYEKIIENIGARALEVMRIGSSSWGRNFSVRGTGKMDASDIDLDIIVEGIPNELHYEETERALLKFQEHFQKGEADYGVIKIKINEIEVSFHIVPTDTIKKFCEIDYENINEQVNLREFRILQTLILKPKTYIDKNFAGEEFSFRTQPKLVDGGQISEIPLLRVGPHNEIILGVVLNRYLPLPVLNNKNEWVKDELNKMINSLINRKKADEERLKDKNLSFVKCHSHSEQMPEWTKDELRALD